MDKFLQLNIGGTIFSMLKSTISIEGSYFEKILSTDIPCIRDNDNNIFIDRSPIYFTHILEYLRTNDISLDGIDRDSLLLEINFYGLEDLEKKILSIEKKVYDRLIKLNVKGTIYYVLESTLNSIGFLDKKHNWIAEDEIFIYRDCTQFDHIVELMYNVNYYPSNLSQNNIQDLCNELMSHELPSLSNKIFYHRR